MSRGWIVTWEEVKRHVYVRKSEMGRIRAGVYMCVCVCVCITLFKKVTGTSLEVQWLRLYLPMLGVQV